MLTLRDLWKFLSPDYAKEWDQKQKEQEIFLRHASPMLSTGQGDAGGLRGILFNKWNVINNGGNYDPKMDRPDTIQDYWLNMKQGYKRFKDPHQYTGYL